MTWRPIASAPKDHETIIDVIVLHVDTGNMRRVTDCCRVYSQRNTVPDTWSSDGKIIHGRRYYDEEGDWCFEWGNVPGAQTVVTHWMSIPLLPSLSKNGLYLSASSRVWPSEFLGRCAFCLDNAYLNRDCNFGLDSQCLVRGVRAQRILEEQSC